MKVSEQELANLFQLIDSREEENIEIAFQLIKGNKALKKPVKERYLNILRFKKGRKNISLLLRVVFEVCSRNLKGTPYLYGECREIFENLNILNINLSNRKLRKIPAWVFYIKQLKLLNLQNNEITEIPSKIGNLTKLEELTLQHNQLSAVPRDIGKLKNLQILNLDFNDIVKMPSEIGKLDKLRWLCLENNKIVNLPKSIKNLKSIEWLSIEGTPLGARHNIHYGTYITVKSPVLKKILRNEK